MASYSQGKDGRWRVRYWLPKDPVTGKRRQKRHPQPFRTKREAENWYAGERLRLDQQRGIPVDDMTLAAYADLWYQGHAQRVRESTAFNYRRILDHYILPLLGDLLITRLQAAQIEAWHAQLAEEHQLSASTIHRCHGLLFQILRHAHRRRAIADNPADLCWPPKATRKRREAVWSEADIRRFLAAADGSERLVFRAAFLTGLRVGELLALEWPDLDLRRGTLTVRRTQTLNRDGAWTVGPPKTARSGRTLALPSSLVRDIRAHRTRQWEARLAVPGWWPHELVFCHPDGRQIARSSLRTALHNLCDAAGVPRVSMHDLRHAATSWLVALNAHPRVIQARLGHESVSMSMDLYAEVASDVDRALADQLDLFLAANTKDYGS